MRPNNFDLLRLIAAISVVFYHTIHRLDIDISWIVMNIFRYIPGVPIFFFISGFLISLSYKNSTSIKGYIKNRVLRIYPALYLCLVLSVFSVIYVGYLDIEIFTSREFWIWIMAQMSFIQFYNPDFLRGYGVGALNGSLWTISVELQFYILVPVLYGYLKIENKNKILIILIVIFSLLNLLYSSLGNSADFRNQTMVYKLLHVSFIPWFYMFLIGVFFQENFDKFKLLYEMNYKYKIIYASIVLLIYTYFSVNPVVFFIFATLIFMLVYSYVNISHKILKGNDYSYGIYIYHAVVINYFLFYGYVNETRYLVYILLISFILSAISWHFVEKPILKYKSNKGKS